jgi:hypothetical protein
MSLISRPFTPQDFFFNQRFKIKKDTTADTPKTATTFPALLEGAKEDVTEEHTVLLVSVQGFVTLLPFLHVEQV